jgi:hypothetical protein
MRRPKLVAMREEMYHKIMRDNKKLRSMSQVAILLSVCNSLFLLALFLLKL